MSKAWKAIDWGDECPVCGGAVEVLTDVEEAGQACDGDEARCACCHYKGWVTVADTDSAWINWEE